MHVLTTIATVNCKLNSSCLLSLQSDNSLPKIQLINKLQFKPGIALKDYTVLYCTVEEIGSHGPVIINYLVLMHARIACLK